MRVSGIGGEFELIKRINSGIRVYSRSVILGIGDDAAIIKYSKNKRMLFTTDMMVEGDHFSRDYFQPEQIGRKAVESNVSDIAAMGGIPCHCLVSLALPKAIDVSFVDRLYAGLNFSARKYRVSIIGGNLTHSEKIIISIAMTGFAYRKHLCLRSEAKVGDLICVTGNLGASAAGLSLLKKRLHGKSVKAHLEPVSQLGLSKSICRYANAMEDVSDGLGQEVSNICTLSRVGAVIYKEKIPILGSTLDDAKKAGKDAYSLALYGGEDFELVFTITEKNFKALARRLKGKITAVGKILPKTQGVTLLDKNKSFQIGKGYDHFR